MKRTVALQIKALPEDAEVLRELEEQFSSACNEVSKIAFQQKERNRLRLHHLSYYVLREHFPSLGSQMCCNAIAKTSQALKAQKTPKEILFKKGCSVHFDKRTYSLKKGILSLFTLKGRRQFELVLGDFQQTFLDLGKAKEAELVRKGKRWFFHLVIDIPDPPLQPVGNSMGVDLGENVLAATSTGKLFGGGSLRFQRDQFLAHRKRLQSNGSQAAKQRLRQISGRERRNVSHVNHCVSKQIVEEAKNNGCTRIILENLKNIRKRIKARLKERTRLHRWAFDQLQSFIEYKAQAQGIHVLYVNPAYSSKLCHECMCLGDRKRHRFFCANCDSLQHSDLNASRTLVRLAPSADGATGEVNRQHIATKCGR